MLFLDIPSESPKDRFFEALRYVVENLQCIFYDIFPSPKIVKNDKILLSISIITSTFTYIFG
jgi:hypothetical protein